MLIGLAGKAGSGKDTAYQYIEARFDNVKHYSFAKKLKESAYQALGDMPFDMNEFKEHGVVQVDIGGSGWTLSGREFLQRYGTEAHRDIFGHDFWIDACLPLSSDHSNEIWVVTDVRFRNEADRIRTLGGVVWAIQRDGSGAGNHASERPLPRSSLNAIIPNNGTLDEFGEVVCTMVEELWANPIWELSLLKEKV